MGWRKERIDVEAIVVSEDTIEQFEWIGETERRAVMRMMSLERRGRWNIKEWFKEWFGKGVGAISMLSATISLMVVVVMVGSAGSLTRLAFSGEVLILRSLGWPNTTSIVHLECTEYDIHDVDQGK